MAAQIYGDPTFIFGIREPKPIVGVPEGEKFRVRMRARGFAHIFIRTQFGVKQHILVRLGDGWAPGPLIAYNLRKSP